VKSLATLKRKLDKVFSLYIRTRDQGKPCITCGKRHELEAGHFIPRQHLATRWDEKNVNGQCSYCNRWLHGNQAEYYLSLVRLYGKPTVDSLMRLKKTTVKLTRADYEKMIERYKKTPP
jgi:5-methylcytosine-specific restriction endonuclease McrA